MIIWRGWGILALLIFGASIGLGVLIAPHAALRGIFAGLTVIGGGVGTWFLGDYLNSKRPVAEFDQWYARRSHEVDALIRGGAYSNVPDPQHPDRLADPNAVGSYVLQQEAARVRAGLTNRHSLFFVPLQYWAYLFGAIGLVFMVVNPFN